MWGFTTSRKRERERNNMDFGQVSLFPSPSDLFLHIQPVTFSGKNHHVWSVSLLSLSPFMGSPRQVGIAQGMRLGKEGGTRVLWRLISDSMRPIGPPLPLNDASLLSLPLSNLPKAHSFPHSLFLFFRSKWMGGPFFPHPAHALQQPCTVLP